jgi:hypothetical protein
VTPTATIIELAHGEFLIFLALTACLPLLPSFSKVTTVYFFVSFLHTFFSLSSRSRSILLSSSPLSSPSLAQHSLWPAANRSVQSGRFPFNDSYGGDFSDLDSRLASPSTSTKAGARDSLQVHPQGLLFFISYLPLPSPAPSE